MRTLKIREILNALNLTKTISAAAVILSFTSLSAQTEIVHVVMDLESWSTAGMIYKPLKQLKIEGTANLRLRHNSSLMQQYFGELSMGYKPIKNLTLGGELRLGKRVWDDDMNALGNFNRKAISGEYELGIGRMTLEPRLAYQVRNQFDSENATTDIDKYLRLRLSLAYNIKNWAYDPDVSFEVFRHQNAKNGPELSKYRLKLGTDFNLKGPNELKVFAAYDHDFNGEYPLNTTIIGAKYRFTIKRKSTRDE